MKLKNIAVASAFVAGSLMSIGACAQTVIFSGNPTAGFAAGPASSGFGYTLGTSYSLASGATINYSYTGYVANPSTGQGAPNLGLRAYATSALSGAGVGNSSNLLTTSSTSYSGSFTLTSNATSLALTGGGSVSTQYYITNLLVTISGLGPASNDTQSSLQLSANALQGIYALQTSAITSGLSYDCTVFDKDGICVSTGGRYSRVNTGNTQTSNGLLIGAYRLSNQVRLGAWLDQNLSSNTATGVNLNNGSPMFGVYGVWNEQPTGNGFEVKVSAGYGNRDLSVTRQVVGTSEAGTGTTQLNAQGISAVVSYNLPINTMWTASPYLGLRYTKVGASGYTETSGASSAPLTYNALNQETKTALAGLKMSGRMSADCGVFASAGVEQDLTNNGGDYAASGNQLTLTTIALSPTIKRTRGAVSAGTYYDVDKAQRISLSAMYREEAFVATNTLSTMLMYTAGF